MRKHCEQLHQRLIQWEQEERRKEMVEGKGSRTTTPCGSPDLPKRKARQHLLDPIRRWNSFHNSRERRPQRQALPYLQTLEQFRKNQETRSSEVFANVCSEMSRDYGNSYMPMLPQGSESLEKASRILGTNVAHELIALSLANLKEAAKSPTRKQFSSPNLIDPMRNSPRCRRTSSDSCQVDYSAARSTSQKQITKTLSTSNPEDLPNQKIPIPKLSINESPQIDSSTTSGIESLRKTSSSSTVSSCSSKTVPRVVALRTESVSELLATSPLSSSLPSDVGLLPPSAPQLPRRRFSVW